jgi:hypothetical protein
LIRWLCLGEDVAKNVDPRGLQIYAAKITGPLNLAFATVPFPLTFLNCYFDSEADLRYVRIPALSLRGSSTRSINLEEAEIRGDLLIGNGFSCIGQVKVNGGKIGGDLDCRRGTFHYLGRVALTATSCEVKANAFLNGGFCAEGEVQLARAKIAGDLECNDGTFRNPKSAQWRSGTALRLDGAEVKGDIKLYGGFNADGEVSLQEAKAGTLWDDEASWPAPGNLLLNGFVYGSFAHGPTDAESRIRWLGLQQKPTPQPDQQQKPTPQPHQQEKIAPQPYQQLAKVLRETGDDDGAKRVLFELEKRSRKDDKGFKLVEDAFSGATVGYGVYPGWAVWWACGLAAAGWIVHRRAGRMGAMAPTDKDAYDEFSKGKMPEHYQPFNPLIYSIENCIPLVKLGQDDLWAADPSPQPRAAPLAVGKFRRSVSAVLDWVVPDVVIRPAVLRWIRWIMIALGWLLATFFGAALSGFLKSG